MGAALGGGPRNLVQRWGSDRRGSVDDREVTGVSSGLHPLGSLRGNSAWAQPSQLKDKGAGHLSSTPVRPG